MKKKTVNLLELMPCRAPHLQWRQEEDGTITVLRPNRGFWNRLARLLYAAPKQTSVRLDSLGSFVWTRLDGSCTVASVAAAVEMQFGATALPLYPRLSQYLQTLCANGFIIYQAQ